MERLVEDKAAFKNDLRMDFRKGRSLYRKEDNKSFAEVTKNMNPFLQTPRVEGKILKSLSFQSGGSSKSL